MLKQKIQLEKVQVEAKLKKVEEDLVQIEDANTKVYFPALSSVRQIYYVRQPIFEYYLRS